MIGSVLCWWMVVAVQWLSQSEPSGYISHSSPMFIIPLRYCTPLQEKTKKVFGYRNQWECSIEWWYWKLIVTTRSGLSRLEVELFKWNLLIFVSKSNHTFRKKILCLISFSGFIKVLCLHLLSNECKSLIEL